MAQPKPTSHDSDFFTKIEDFFNENQKVVSGVASVILLIILGYLLFDQYYLAGQEKQAQADIIQAQFYFERDSFNVALNGQAGMGLQEDVVGFLDIIDDYGMTKAANLSHYYAGICYLNLGQYDAAIDHLNKFDSDDEFVGAMALGGIGDAYSEKGNMSEAISYYKKAANYNDNDVTSPMFLFKAGLAYEAQNQPAEALKMYEQIEQKYPASTQGQSIAPYIARVK